MFGLSIWLRLLIFIGGMALGFFFLLKPLYIVSITGQMPWAEQKIGPGGTYTAIKLFGILIMVVAVIALIDF